jgi:hypothetical protein
VVSRARVPPEKALKLRRGPSSASLPIVAFTTYELQIINHRLRSLSPQSVALYPCALCIAVPCILSCILYLPLNQSPFTNHELRSSTPSLLSPHDVQATDMDVGRYASKEGGGRAASGTSRRGQRMEQLSRSTSAFAPHTSPLSPHGLSIQFKFFLPRFVLLPLRLVGLGQEKILEHQVIHFRAHETAVSIFGGTDDWFAADVEGRIHQ